MNFSLFTPIKQALILRYVTSSSPVDSPAHLPSYITHFPSHRDINFYDLYKHRLVLPVLELMHGIYHSSIFKILFRSNYRFIGHCKEMYREVLCTIYLASPNINIIHNYNMVS